MEIGVVEKAMSRRWGEYELDVDQHELLRAASPVTLEPQVLAVLSHLVSRAGALVTRDELIDHVWGGRIVSDSAIASRIKSARAAIGDDGVAQHSIRTVHGFGWRFVATVTNSVSATYRMPELSDAEGPPSIAVLPFACNGLPAALTIIGTALPHDVIVELGRLRWMKVIARHSSFRLATDTSATEVGSRLGVRYVLSGHVERDGHRLRVAVELVRAADEGIVWAERFHFADDDVHDVRSAITRAIVSALELRIPVHEADAARTMAGPTLPSWSSYHLGLHHAFRFTATDNAQAARRFEEAIAREPGFARAHAGLSFAHFQSAFLGYEADRGHLVAAARDHANRAVSLDPLDPFANFAMGRSFWLEANLAGSEPWLERAIELAPSYAQGRYACGLTDVLSGRGATGQANVDEAMTLGPIDPLHYAMAATRGLSHFVRGDLEQAAYWAERAANEPGAHVLIAVIACAVHTLHGDDRRARRWAAIVSRDRPGFQSAEFFASFPFAEPAHRTAIAEALGKRGF